MNGQKKRYGLFTKEVGGKSLKQLEALLKETGKNESLCCPHLKPQFDKGSNVINYKDGFMTEKGNGVNVANIVRSDSRKFNIFGQTLKIAGKVFRCNLCGAEVFVPDYETIKDFAGFAVAAYDMVGIVESFEHTLRATTEVDGMDRWSSEVGPNFLTRYVSSNFENKRLTKANTTVIVNNKKSLWNEILHGGEYRESNRIDMESVIEQGGSQVKTSSVEMMETNYREPRPNNGGVILGDLSGLGGLNAGTDLGTNKGKVKLVK